MPSKKRSQPTRLEVSVQSRAMLVEVPDGGQVGPLVCAVVADGTLTFQDGVERHDGFIGGLSLVPEDPADGRVRNA
jgi:hypothetical protein